MRMCRDLRLSKGDNALGDGDGGVSERETGGEGEDEDEDEKIGEDMVM